MTETVLRKSIFLKATPKEVCAYLTDPEKLAIWFHKPTTPLVEGAYEMFGTESGDKLMWGDVTVSDPYSTLEYTFTIAPMGDAVSTVKWKLVEVAGGTNLILHHEGLPQGADSFGLTLALDKGWDDHLDRMRTSLHGE